MNIQDALNLIGRIEYKPDHALRADYSTMEDSAVMRITAIAWVKDVRNPTKVVRVELPVTMSTMDIERMTKEDLIHWVRDHVIFRFERHEMNEWIKVDGVRIFDPHRLER